MTLVPGWLVCRFCVQAWACSWESRRAHPRRCGATGSLCRAGRCGRRLGAAGAAIVAGGGGEWLVASGLGVGGEAGIFKTLGVVSLNGSWHFGQRSHETGLQPFVTSGYTYMDGESGFPAWNAGGGVIVWGHHRGLRLEFRDHVRPDERGALHYWALRAGLTFG